MYVKENYYTKSTPKNITSATPLQEKSNFYFQPAPSAKEESDVDFLWRMTHIFNTQGENEEFLSPEEYVMCNPGCDDIPAPQLTKSRSKKPKKSSRDEN